MCGRDEFSHGDARAPSRDVGDPVEKVLVYTERDGRYGTILWKDYDEFLAQSETEIDAGGFDEIDLALSTAGRRQRG